MIDTLTKRHLLSVATGTACLRRVCRVDLDELTPSFFRFGAQLTEKGRPCRVADALRKAMSVQHPIDVEVFDTDHAKSVDNLSGLLMREVISFERHTFMHTGNHLAMLPTFGCSLRTFGMLALYLYEGFLFTAKETRVRNLFCIGERCKRCESDINAYLGRYWVKTLWVALTRKGDVPLVRTALVNGRRFDGATDRTVIHHLDGADFGECDTALMGDAEPALGKGEGVIASIALEARIPRLLTSFEATEERFHAQINANCHVLQHLRMDTIEGGALFFQHRIGRLLPVATQTLTLLEVRILAVLKQVVIQPPALFKGAFKACELVLRRKEPILKGFYHGQSVA